MTIEQAGMVTSMWSNITEVQLDLYQLSRKSMTFSSLQHAVVMQQIKPALAPVSVAMRNDQSGFWTTKILESFDLKRCQQLEFFWVTMTDAVIAVCSKARPTTLIIEPYIHQYLTSNARQLVLTCGSNVVRLRLRRASQPIIDAAGRSCPLLTKLSIDEASPGVHLEHLLRTRLQALKLSRYATRESGAFFDEFDGVLNTVSTTLQHFDVSDNWFVPPCHPTCLGVDFYRGFSNLVSLRVSGLGFWCNALLVNVSIHLKLLKALWYTPLTCPNSQMSQEGAACLGTMKHLHGVVLPSCVLPTNDSAKYLVANAVKIIAADGYKGPYSQTLVFRGSYAHPSALWDALYAGKRLRRPLNFPDDFM
ncbi:MAG: hypothetical protein ACPGR8_01160 [Limisphaerales bacterium]